MGEGCVFCKIVKGEIPAKVVHETDDVIAIEDAAPVAKVHVLVMPKRHFPDLVSFIEQDGDGALGRKVNEAVLAVARKKGVDKDGFRVIGNCGEHGGQTVPHLHYHVIGGEPLGAKLV